MAIEFQGAMISRDVAIERRGPSERKIAKAKRLGREAAIVYHTISLTPWLFQEVKEAEASV